MLVGLLAWLRLRQAAPDRGMRWNRTGLVASTLYLVWTVAAQTHVEGAVRRSIAATPLENKRVLVTPAPLNSLLWRVVVMDDDGYHEGFRSLFDASERIPLERHASAPTLLDSLRDDWTVQRLAWFSKGFYSVRQESADLRIAAGAPGTISQARRRDDRARGATRRQWCNPTRRHDLRWKTGAHSELEVLWRVKRLPPIRTRGHY